MATIKEKIEAQRIFVQLHKAPHFAPTDGKCWTCGKQIYDLITIEEAASSLITGCPHCHRSYCD